MLTLVLLKLSLAVKKQRAQGNLLRENEMWKVLKSEVFVWNSKATVSKSEKQVIELLYVFLMNNNKRGKSVIKTKFQ
jgi:hypothetical protein